MTTREKVRQAIDHAESVADDQTQSSMVRTAAATLGMFRPQLEQWLPQDDAELDRLLEQGAQWMWSLRGDTLEPGA
jgi:hypothetical protein